MAIYMTREQTQLVVSGKTFDVKEVIKSLGGKWDPARRCWRLPLELDTEDTRTRLGALTKKQQDATESAAAAVGAAAVGAAAVGAAAVGAAAVGAAAVQRAAKAAKKEEAAKRAEKRRAALAAKNLELVKSCLADTSGKYSWVCCEHCEIVDLKKGHISCRAHAHWDGQSWCSFRVFGSVYTGN
jgi:hypothetical protein